MPQGWERGGGARGPALVSSAATDLRVLLASGWYDLATPFFGAEMALYKNGVVLDRVQFDYYDAGHMMYLAEADGKKLSDDVRAFIRAGQ